MRKNNIKTKWKEGVLYFQPFGRVDDFYQKVPLERFNKEITYSMIEKEYIKNKIYWLGTDKYGRDLLSRILIGSRVSLSIGLVAVFISLIIL